MNCGWNHHHHYFSSGGPNPHLQAAAAVQNVFHNVNHTVLYL